MGEDATLEQLVEQLARFDEEAWRVPPETAAKVRAVLGERIRALGGEPPASVEPPDALAQPSAEDAPEVLADPILLEELPLEDGFEPDGVAPEAGFEPEVAGFDFDLAPTPGQSPTPRQEHGPAGPVDRDNPRYEDLSQYALPAGQDGSAPVVLPLDGTPEPAPEAGSGPLGQAVLVVRAGTDDEEVLPLVEDLEISLGRGKDCGIRLKDARASRVHCRVYFAEGAWRVEDLGSANGTLVNGEYLPPREPRLLRGGEELVVGSSAVRFEMAASTSLG